MSLCRKAQCTLNKKLSCRRRAAQCFASLNISLSRSRSFEITPLHKACESPLFNCNCVSISIVQHRAAIKGHSNTVRWASLERCAQTPATSAVNLPRSGGTLFITSDGRIVDNMRWSEKSVENSDFYRATLCTAPTMPWQDVCPSVCLSVTRRYSVETVTHILKLFSPRVATLF